MPKTRSLLDIANKNTKCIYCLLTNGELRCPHIVSLTKQTSDSGHSLGGNLFQAMLVKEARKA